MLMRLAGVLTALTICLCAFSKANAQLDPYAIFARAKERFASQHYPPYLDYDVAVRVQEGGTQRIERYASAYNATNDEIFVDPVSDYERVHPASGRGVNMSFLFFSGKPEPPVDFLGVPRLAPTYSFGMAKFSAMPPTQRESDSEIVSEIRKAFHDPNPRSTPSPTPKPSSGLREIAAVTAYTHDYNITLAGEETVVGRPCYHLALVPVRMKDRRLRLRDLWIDEDTFSVEKLREALNFTSGPGTGVAWTVDFADVGDAHYISQERADAPMSYRGLVYVQASISFENVRPRTTPATLNAFKLTNDLVMEEPAI
ncbi:MAG: hypothetical protein M3R35_04390 [Candidatus Eremiobacteraeota bacterium]|nr:hypothetical protein [Candidatus Eremiobacteraeota bacterium]